MKMKPRWMKAAIKAARAEATALPRARLRAARATTVAKALPLQSA